MVEGIANATDRKSLVTATRALDRVLSWNHFVIPQWHARFERIAYWNIFGRSAITPKYGIDFMSWWIDPVKQAKTLRNIEERGHTR